MRGWLVKPADTIAPLLVYFGGNAEEASSLIAMADRFEGRAIALVNYRGYGESSGRPSEAALLADAVAVYDALVARSDVNGAQTAVMGRLSRPLALPAKMMRPSGCAAVAIDASLSTAPA